MRKLYLSLLFFLCMAHSVQAQQAYAVLSDNGKTVTFYYDTQKESRGGVPLSDWKSEDCPVKKAIFDRSFEGYLPTSIGAWFRDCSQLETIIGIENLNTTNVTNMQAMFLNCSSITTLDLSSFNTENVTNMIQVFYGCSSLTSINLRNFNTTKVTNMTGLFYKCTSLTNIDLSSFNTPNVKNISDLVQLCSSLKTLDLRNFDTSKVTDMSGMFYGCSSLTQLNLNCFDTTNATEMSWMFSGCTSLTTIDVSNFNTEKVTGMHHMFYQCSSLESLDLSSFNTVSVERMWNMFTDCSSLKTIYVSEKWSTDNVTNGGGMFNKCIKLVGGMGTTYDETKTNHTYAHIDGGTANPGYLTDINGSETENKGLKVGDTFAADGITYKVTSTTPMEVQVGTGVNGGPAIDKETSGKVSIPSSVTGSDGNSYSVTCISRYAFQSCKQLTSVVFPNSLKKIECEIFQYCPKLESIVIPRSVISIELGAFFACNNLTSITVENGNPVYDSRNGCNAIIKTETNELIAGCNSTIIPNTVTSIADYAFTQQLLITSISIPNSIISIGEWAFWNCDHVESLVIPNSVVSIGEEAFCAIHFLESLTIGKSVSSIGKGAFKDCYFIKEISSLITEPFGIPGVFPEGKRINETATLYVPAGTKAKYEATEGWNLFKNIVEMGVIEDNLTYDFGEEGNLTVTGTVDGQETTIEIPAKIVIDGREYIVTIIAADAFKDNTNLQSVTIPETVEKIGVNAFSGCSSLSAVILPEKVNAIGEGAFSGCSSIKTMELPKSVSSIGDSAFKDCSSMSSVKILCSPENVGAGVFAGCDNLKEAEFNCATVTPVLQKTKVERVKIEESVTAIDKEAFLECKNLASIDIPESVERIGESAFNGCSGIKAIELPKSVTKIEESAFGKCTEMLTLKIGEGIKEIQSAAFSDCVKLTDVYVYAKELPTTSSEAFKDTDVKQITLHVPEESVKDYERTAPWIDFKMILPIADTRPKCETPTISYTSGKLTFSSETEDADFVYEISDTDIQKGNGTEVQLSVTYQITVYATKEGYKDSDVATATLCWIDAAPQTEGITNGAASVRASAVLIQSAGGVLTVTGAPEGSEVSVYSMNGQKVGSARVSAEATHIGTTLRSGEVGIVKIGDRSVKVLVK